jgi:PTH1 family peptidyl-tRNA hydrolase
MVAPLAKYYRIEPQDITVLHDDVDLPFGTVRIKAGGGEAGHNGLRSVTKHLGTQDYVRIRIGIGRSQNPNIPTDKHVLSNFTASEEKELPFIFETVSDAIDAILADGVLKAQAVIN